MQQCLARCGTFAAALVAAGTALAGPFDPLLVSPGATWAGHIDVQALRASAIGQFICANQNGMFKLDDLSALRAKLGMDPLTEMHGLTLYGASGSDAVLVATATGAVDGLIARLPELVTGFEAVPEGDRTIYSWADDKGRQYCMLLPAPDPAERRVVLASARERVLAAVALIDHPPAAAPALHALPGEGSIVFFTSMDVDAMAWKPASKVVQNTKAFTIDVGERAGQMYGELELTAKSEKQAQNISMMGQVIIAGLKWGNQRDPEAAEIQKLADAIGMSVEGTQVKVSWRFDCHELMQIVEETEKKKPDDKPSNGNPTERASGGK